MYDVNICNGTSIEEEKRENHEFTKKALEKPLIYSHYVRHNVTSNMVQNTASVG
jgi:hypothetical protein